MPTPLSRAGASRLKALHQRRNREESGLFLAEGVRVVEELLASSLAVETAVVAPSLEDTERGRNLAQLLDRRTTLLSASDAELRDLAGTDTPQGVLAVARMPQHALPEPLPPRAPVLVLDALQDPGNVGTLLRSADAFGAAAVVALPGTVDVWNPKVVRAAAGAAFRLPIVATTLADLVSWSERQGASLWGADTGGEDVASIDPAERVLLLLGNEGAGLGEATRRALTRTVAIPIRAGAESLNVAMAGTVLLYLLTARR